MRTITIRASNVARTDQVNFPILVSGVFPYLASVGNGGKVQSTGGYDIIFTSDPGGTNILDYEIDNYDPVSGTLSTWIRIPLLSHSSDTSIYLWYGIPGVSRSQENTSGVWSNGYLSVYHFGNGSSVGVTDSASAGYTLSGSAAAGSGIIGGGAVFSGDATTYLYHDSVPAYPTGQSPLTLEAWTRNTGSSDSEVFGYGDNYANGDRAGLWLAGTTSPMMEFENMGIVATNLEPTDGTWHHVVGVYGGGSLSITADELYIDGVPLPVSASAGTPSITATQLKIGGIPTVDHCCAWTGSVDEVRVSSGARSADWVATEYANQANPGTFSAVGAEVVVTSLPTLRSPAAYRRLLTIDHNQVPNTDQINFPLLVSGTFPDLRTGANGGKLWNANGYDVIFTSDAAGQVQLDHEIEAYNPATGAASFWIRLPSLSHSVDTSFYMWYSSPTITTSQERKNSVWSNGYAAVYHMGTSSSPITADSTGTSTSTSNAGVTQVSGFVGAAGDFGEGGSLSYLRVPSASVPKPTSNLTLEAWANPRAVGQWNKIIGLDYSATGAWNYPYLSYALETHGGEATSNMQVSVVGGTNDVPSDSRMPLGSWTHLAGTFDGSTRRMFFNGINEETNTYSQGPIDYGTSQDLTIGADSPYALIPQEAWNGLLDEVRISTVARSADWIATEYHNMSAPSAFYSIGAPTGPFLSPPGGTASIALSCSPATITAGASSNNVICTAVLTAGSQGSVVFSLDGQSLSTATIPGSGSVSITMNFIGVGVGVHQVTAVWSDTSATASVTVTPTIPPGTVYSYSITQPDGKTSGYAPNGNVVAYTDLVNGTWSSIQYDALNRLISAQASPAVGLSQASNFCWGYDSFGNRTSQVQSNQAISSDGKSCTPQSPSTAIWTGKNTAYTALNRIDYEQDPVTSMNKGAPVQYEAAGGNVSADGLTSGTQHAYLYDAEGRICAVQIPPAMTGLPNQMFQYLYDAEGNRIGKGTITQWNCDTDHNSFQLTNEYVLGQSGEQVTEFDGNGKWLHTNAYAGGQLIATYDLAPNQPASPAPPVEALHYQLADWLGTRRMQVSPSAVAEGTCQSLPFGDQLNCVQTTAANSDDATEHHFTGKERDAESGLDYFGARYYASGMGRWMSPDWAAKPEAVPYSDLANPQSLNLYGYEGNNPLSKADKDGHCWPLCTILAGAAVGAVTGAGIEAATEYFSTGKVDLNKVGNAALGGLVTGAIIGAAGPEAGLAAKVAIGAVAGVAGGAVERGVNGEKVMDGKAIAIDAAAGAVSPKVDAVADKTFATEAIAKTVPKAIDATIDAGKRMSSGGEQPKQQQQQQQKQQQKTCTSGSAGCN